MDNGQSPIGQSPLDEKSLDERMAQMLAENEFRVLEGMQEHGTLTEPTTFSYSKLVNFYMGIVASVSDYDRYAKDHPAHEKTLAKQREIIATNFAVVDFHSAWYAMNLDNEKPLLEDEFKSLEPKKRQEIFVDMLDKKRSMIPKLYATREKAIALCIERGILPQDYI